MYPRIAQEMNSRTNVDVMPRNASIVNSSLGSEDTHRMSTAIADMLTKHTTERSSSLPGLRNQCFSFLIICIEI